METAVEKLEAMFLKSKADLEYIEKRLKLDFINNIAENGSHAEMENPAAVLGELRAIKAKYAKLFLEMEQIAAAQKQSMNSVRTSMNAITELTQHLQHTRDLEMFHSSHLLYTNQSLVAPSMMGKAYPGSLQHIFPLWTFTDSLIVFIKGFEPEVGPVDASGQQQPISCEIKQLSDTVFKGVPLSIRSKVKLAEVNIFYQQLQELLCKNSNSCLSVQKMKQLKINVSEAKLKVLQHLALIEIDKKGSVCLFNCN